MKRKGMSILAVIMIVFTFAASGNVSANQGKSVSTPAATQATKSTPKVAEPNLSWQDQYPDYYKVRMLSATDGWIVGAEGAIRRYASGQWVAYASPVTTTLRSVYPISDTAFAVGDNNAILQLIGDAWQTTSAPAGCTNFHDAWMLSPTDGWAVGGTCDITPTGVIAHYNGTDWQNVSVPYPLPQMNALQMLSSNEGWFVGNDAALLHYLNGTWQAYNGICSDIISIAMLPDGSEGWAGYTRVTGNGCYTYDTVNVIHYLHGVWSTTASARSKPKESPDPYYFDYASAYGIAALNASSRWFVGTYKESGSNYSSAHGAYYQGGASGNAWDGAGSGVDTDAYPLNSLAMLADNDIWAVGNSGYIKHYDGHSWNNIAGAPLNIYGLGYNPVRGELYQAGSISEGQDVPGLNGSILVTNLLTASPVLSCTTPQVIWRDIATTSTSSLDAWAVGYSFYVPYYNRYLGYAAHITASGCDVTQITTDSLNSLVVVSPSLVVAVGDEGTLAVYTGTWQMATLGTSNLLGIAYKDGRYWVVGEQGALYTTSGDPEDAASWQMIATYGQFSLRSVSAVSNNEAWVVGQRVRFHVVDNNATREDSNNNLNKVYMVDANNGWAVGADGSIEHFSDAGWANYITDLPGLNTLVFTPNGDGWIGGPALQVLLGYPYYVGGDHMPYIEGHLLHFAPVCDDYYSDVPASYYARRYILDLSCRGIVSGMGNHIYAPDANTTRIQFAKIISLARGWQLITPTTPTFSDVPTSNPLYSFVETAYANHALSGASPATCQARGLANPCFLPNDAISRAQAVIITVRAFGWPIDTSGGPHFSDVPAGSYAYEAVETAYHRGVVNGIGNGTFGPGFNVARSQIAKIVDLSITSH